MKRFKGFVYNVIMLAFVSAITLRLFGIIDVSWKWILYPVLMPIVFYIMYSIGRGIGKAYKNKGKVVPDYEKTIDEVK